MQLKNAAAWLPAEKTQLAVGEAPYPSCADDELIIHNHAVAVNPVDWKVQSFGRSGLEYPTILGEDVAGKVLHVGAGLRDVFYAGQRVIGFAKGLNVKASQYGGFQEFLTLKGAEVSAIPDDITFTDAVVLPLSIATASAGLYLKKTLGLPTPKAKPTATVGMASGKTPSVLLLWGGSSSVGSSVIQLASASGYDIVATASPSNFDHCKKLGAAATLDYHDPNIISALIDTLRGRTVIGAYDAIGTDSTVKQCAAVLHALGGGRIASVGAAPDHLGRDVEAVKVLAAELSKQEPKIATAIWGQYIPSALASGDFIPSPAPLIVGKGLAAVQKGLDRQKRGVSAQKVVIVL